MIKINDSKMPETAKERFYREELESIKLDLLEARPVSPSNIAKALIEADELPVTTDFRLKNFKNILLGVLLNRR